jgi:hypothetical protein
MTTEYTFEVNPCRRVDLGQVEVTDTERAEFWSLYRRPTVGDQHGAKLAEWQSDHPTEAEAVRAQLDAMLPADLKEAGYRLEFGGADHQDEELRGMYWWTLARAGWSEAETSDAQWATAQEALDDAQESYDDGCDIDDDEWETVKQFFGLDPSYVGWTVADQRQYIADFGRIQSGNEKALNLLEELVAWNADAFDNDTDVDGSDAVDFIGNIRQRAKAAVALITGKTP